VADARHKRDTDARPARFRPRASVIAGGLAASVTAAAVLAGVAATRAPSSGDTSPVAAQEATTSAPSGSAAGAASARRDVVSRSFDRTQTVGSTRLVREQRDPVTRWTTAKLNLWTLPGDTGRMVGVLDPGKKVTATGVTAQGREEVLLAAGATRWVTDGYLSSDKPQPPAPASASASAQGGDGGGAATTGLSTAPCPDSSVENGLASDTIAVYRAVCHAFPQVQDYLGWGNRPEHDTGHALDVMVYGDKALGDEIAAWAQAHASELNLYDVIWYDRIWTPERSSEGWRDYGDHGSPTANHMDHVHIGTN
jgi:hypothetical protein